MRFLRMLWECITLWRPEPATEEELRKCDAVFAFADSRMRDGSPGPGNEFIAAGCRELCERYGLPLLVQDEVALAAEDLECRYVARGPQHGKSGRRWNTATITDEFAAICRQERWCRIVIVSTPDHLLRCCWVARKRGFEAVCAEMPEGHYFHPDLALWACRGGKYRFRARDFLVRLYFLFRGDI